MQDQDSNRSLEISEVSEKAPERKPKAKSLRADAPKEETVAPRSLTYNLNQRANETIAKTHGVI